MNSANIVSSPACSRVIAVLLVDGSRQNELLVRTCLKDTSYRVDVVENDSLAYDRIQNGHYDLILTNIPPAAGANLARRVREWERIAGRAPRPLIALTYDPAGAGSEYGDDVESGAPRTRAVDRQLLLDALNRYEASRSKPVATNVAASINALAAVYLSRRRTDLQALRDALVREDFAVVARLGHNLKGTGAPYGFPRITDIGRSLERSGKEKDTAQATRDLAELAAFLDSVELAPK